MSNPTIPQDRVSRFLATLRRLGGQNARVLSSGLAVAALASVADPALLAAYPQLASLTALLGGNLLASQIDRMANATSEGELQQTLDQLLANSELAQQVSETQFQQLLALLNSQATSQQLADVQSDIKQIAQTIAQLQQGVWVNVARDWVMGNVIDGNVYEAQRDLQHHKNPVTLEGSARAEVVVGGSGNYVTNILGQLRNMPLEEADMRREIGRYLNWVIEHNSRIKLTGIKRADGQINEMSLDDVYVPLEARITLNEKELRQLGKHPRHLAEVQEREQAISLNQLWAQGDRLVIIGGPGSGKSTVLMHIAWVLASAIVQNNPSLAAEKLNVAADTLPLPIFIPLNRFADHLRNATSAAQRTLTDFIAHYMIERNSASFGLPPDFFQQLLEQRQSVILLLDGLDEVPDEGLRGIVTQKIEDLVKGQTGLRVIVTCRAAAYNKRTILGYSFREIKVQPLDESHVAHLVHKAYHAVESDPVYCAAQIEDLLQGIAKMEQKRQQRTGNEERLVTSPLMVRMFLIVHMGASRLPEQRAELYHKAVENLILSQHHRDEETRLELENLVGDEALHNSLLQTLAFYMHGEGEETSAEETPADELTLVKGREIEEQALRRLLTSLELFEPLVTPFIKVTKERGTLMEERLETYRFIHLGFQEFLTARYMADELGYRQQLAEFILDKERLLASWWREPFLLLVGYLSLTAPRRVTDLVRFLAGLGALEGQRLPNGGSLAWAGAELMGTALLEWPKAPEKLREAVAKRLVELIEGQLAYPAVPARLRANLGDALAELGDPREGVCTREPLMLPVAGAKFEMAKYLVTNAQYRYFIEDGGYTGKWDNMWSSEGLKRRKQEEWQEPRYWDDSRFNRANQPVVGISWYEAEAYANWLSEVTGEKYRLPTDEEWLQVAENPQGGDYAWGKWAEGYANTREAGIERTSAVGMFPQGAAHNGALDVTGNVWEWTTTWYDKDKDSFVVRGGSWDGFQVDALVSVRLRNVPHDGYYLLGVRLVRVPHFSAL